MSMSFIMRENFDHFESADSGPVFYESRSQSPPIQEKVKIIPEKLTVPEVTEFLERPRLDRLVQRSLEQTGSVLVAGRAGTGKTAFASKYSQGYDRVIWYRIETSDRDWKIFSSHLFAAIDNKAALDHDSEVAVLVETLLGECAGNIENTLFVLDDVHNVFDAPWFDEFFHTMLYALPADMHLISLSRSMPSLPLWRLRSKQVLSVIEENILVFDEKESLEFCKHSGVGRVEAERLYAESFGRVGKLKTLIESI